MLGRWQAGDESANDELIKLVYDELRGLARHYLQNERVGHTMLTTDLVHEAYLRLNGSESLELHNRNHFLVIAAQTMRRILIDHARRYHADKRIARDQKIALDDAPTLLVAASAEVLEIHQALELLSKIHPRQAQLVELKFFGGLSTAELVEVLGVSEATVIRDWRVARIWLHRQLGDGPS